MRPGVLLLRARVLPWRLALFGCRRALLGSFRFEFQFDANRTRGNARERAIPSLACMVVITLYYTAQRGTTRYMYISLKRNKAYALTFIKRRASDLTRES